MPSLDILVILMVKIINCFNNPLLSKSATDFSPLNKKVQDLNLMKSSRYSWFLFSMNFVIAFLWARNDQTVSTASLFAACEFQSVLIIIDSQVTSLGRKFRTSSCVSAIFAIESKWLESYILCLCFIWAIQPCKTYSRTEVSFSVFFTFELQLDETLLEVSLMLVQYFIVITYSFSV